MSRIGPALAVACLALGACASPGVPAVPPNSQVVDIQTKRFGGALHVEPFAIVFSRGRGPAQTVRVWQKGYFGRYNATNLCSGISVHLKGYVDHAGSLWQVKIRHNSRAEECTVVFTGSGAHRGKKALHISIFR